MTVWVDTNAGGKHGEPNPTVEFDTGTPGIALKGDFLPVLKFTLVLVLAHRRGVFFLVAAAVLCFGFMKC